MAPVVAGNSAAQPGLFSAHEAQPTMKSITALLLAAIAAAAFTLTPARAAILVSDWDITGDTLSFHLTGTIDPGANIGATDNSVFYIGAPGNADWVLLNSTIAGTVNQGSGHRLIDTTSGGYITFTLGDYATLSTADFQPWQVGDSVDALVTISGGTLDAGAIDPAQIIVAAGFDELDVFPDSANTVGGYAIPEPATYAGLLGLGALGLVVWKRRLAHTLTRSAA